MSADPCAYLELALQHIEREAVRSLAVDWETVREQAQFLARNAISSADTYPAIELALRALGDHHTFGAGPTQPARSPRALRRAASTHRCGDAVSGLSSTRRACQHGAGQFWMSSQTQILPFTLLFCVSDTIYLEVSAAEEVRTVRRKVKQDAAPSSDECPYGRSCTAVNWNGRPVGLATTCNWSSR